MIVAIRALLEMFLPRAAELVTDMQQAEHRDDRPALRRHAHALRGISGTVRANRMFALLEPAEVDADIDVKGIASELLRVQGYLAEQLGVRADQSSSTPSAARPAAP